MVLDLAVEETAEAVPVPSVGKMALLTMGEQKESCLMLEVVLVRPFLVLHQGACQSKFPFLFAICCAMR